MIPSKKPYVRVCKKCGKKYFTNRPLSQKCDSCLKKSKLKKHLRYNPLKVREAHNRDKYTCRFCGVNVSNNPYTVKYKDEYYTSCSGCCQKSKKELFFNS